MEYPEDCEDLPDGTNPKEIRDRWAPWISECVMFLDGKGTFRHFKYGNDYSAQPWIDVLIYRAIAAKWVELMNEKIEAQRPKT